MQRSNLQVMVRPRRLPEGAQRSPIKLDKYGHEIEMLDNLFQYDVVFEEEASQEQVYERLRSAVEKLVEGYCVGILAYGQTSSGKTYTIGTNGVEECYVANPGIISRAASDIFRLAVPREETSKIIVKVTFMEIYNEQAFDLLHVDEKKKPIIKKVRDIPRKDRPNELVTDVEGLIAEEVLSTQEVMEVLQKGSKNRRVAATSMNANSSRSHAVFTIYVEHLNDEGESTLASTPYLQLVDLAGSEKPEGNKTTMKEGVNINKSLLALGRVIIQRRDRWAHVSYRDSVLTRVLKPLLDGNSITTLIACISMEERNEAESKKTLHYAQQARKIEILAQKAQKAITRGEYLKLKDENRRLKKLCAQHNLEMGDLEMTILKIKEDETRSADPVAKTEELIQLMLKYEAAAKRSEALQDRCTQLEPLVDMFSKKFDDVDTDSERPRLTFNASEDREKTLIVESSNRESEDIADGQDEMQHELSIVSALTTLDKDYDEHANQPKKKKSEELQEKVLDLERQLELSGKEKEITTKQMTSHKTEKPYACKECSLRFGKASHLKYHTRIHTGEKPFTCDFCGKAFTQAGTLGNHRRLHTGEKPFACELCAAKFSRKDALASHMRSHSGEKSYVCTDCGAAFTHSGNLVVHRRIHTGEKPYDCPDCASSFRSASQFSVHRRRHTDERPHPCDECHKAFVDSGDLSKHKRTHSGEKPYLCDKCPAKFLRKISLTNHKRTHTGEKPYLCDKCPAMFSHKNSLTNHKRTHTGEKPYPCDKCPAKYSKKTSLTNHKRTHSA